MKSVLALLFMSAGVQAHESLVPHTHPHGVSMLPDLGTLVVAAILLIALGLLAYVKISER